MNADATQLLDRWRNGDQEAATQLFQLYSSKLTRVAERQMSQQLSRRVAGEDIVQSAFRSFFRRGARGDFVIDNSAGLWQLLVKITVLKVYGQARRHSAPKRDMRGELSLDDLDGAVLAQEPRPEEAVVLLDLMSAVVADLPESYGEILALRLAGHNRSEIANEVGVTRQTVYRALDLIQDRCRDVLESNNEEG